MLAVRGVTVHYGDTVALDALDLEVGDDEVVCVLGPSGSGKSTLLRTIAGLEHLSAGSIVRDGTDLAGVPPHRRDVGLMFQDHSLFPHRDVHGNVAFGLRMRRLPRDDLEARVREVLEMVGLAGYEHRGVRQLSGGEQQRVALARALAPAPSLLLLDEPLGALDRALREELVVELKMLFDRLQIAVVLVTHDHDEAFALGDRVAVVQRGRVEQIGSPMDVWRRPESEFVARFLGWNVTSALGAQPCAVRPDAVTLTAVGELRGTVVSRTFRRDHFRVLVELDDSRDALDVSIRGAEPPVVGAHVALEIDPDGVVKLGR